MDGGARAMTDAEEKPDRDDSWCSGGQSGRQARLRLRSIQRLAFGVQVSLDEPEEFVRLARNLGE